MSAGDDGTFTEPGTNLRAADRPPPYDLLIDEDKRYDRLKEFARGGAGRILVARDLRLGREVALKEQIAHGRGDARLIREAVDTARLQHPAIVPVYDAAIDHNDVPFYVMKLVVGRSLREAITETRTLAERLALLPTIIAVSEAIAYAHSKGIIHRDLKPHNVLIGDFGETTVIDWGLAKSLADPDAPRGEDVAAPDPLGSSESTKAGAVLGTPAYMPPEQAQSAPIDERADVYALGAMLYHVLAGAPPYLPKEGLTVVDQVLREPPAPLVEREPRAPRDLAAIVTKAMARKPADRYPSARELAEDLKRFQTGRLVAAHEYSFASLFLRWLRRYRAVVAVATVALSVLAAVAVVSVRRIVHERDRFEGQRDAAEDLVQFMLFDLRDQLAPVGRIDLLDRVADRVGAYYRKLDAAIDIVDVQGLRRRAEALLALGQVRAQQGKLEAARSSAEESAAIRQWLALSRSDRQDAQAELAKAFVVLGTIAASEHNFKRSIVYERRALDIADRLMAMDPAEPQHQLRKAEALRALGAATDAIGETRVSIDSFRAAVALDERLFESPATRIAVSRDFAIDLRALGAELTKAANTEEAFPLLTKSLAILGPLVQADPFNVVLLRQLAVTRGSLADARHASGDIDGARSEASACLELCRQVAMRDPENLSSQFMVAHALSSLAALETLRHAAAVARSELDEGYAIMKRILATEPRNYSWQLEFWLNRALLGEIEYRLANDGHAAVTAYRQGLVVLEEMSARSERAGAVQVEIADAHVRIAGVLQSLKVPDEALIHYYKSIALMSERVAADPESKLARHFLAAAHQGIAVIETERHSLDSAFAHAAAALAVHHSLLGMDPSNATWKANVGLDDLLVGEILANWPQTRSQARTHLEHAISRFNDLKATTSYPLDPDLLRTAKADLDKLPPEHPSGTPNKP